MTISKSFKALSIALLSTFVLAACSDDQEVKPEEETTTTTQSSSSSQPPAAPELAQQHMEDFVVDKQQADKLTEADDAIANNWYLERLEEAGITMDSAITFIVRERVCEDIHTGGTLHSIAGDTLSPYDLTGNQQGVIIASSMLSLCPDETLPVPAGSFDNVEQPES